MKKIAFLTLFMAFSTTIAHAQITAVAVKSKARLSYRQQKNGKYHLYNLENKDIIADADTIYITGKAFFHVVKNDKHGIYSSTGKPCIALDYDDIDGIKANYQTKENDYWIVTKGKNVDLYSLEGEQILPPVYEYIEQKRVNTPQQTDFFIVKKDRYGICDAQGNTVVAPIYAHISYKNEFWTLMKESPCDYIFNNKDIVKGININQTTPPINYNSKRLGTDFSFEKDGLWGIIGNNGQTIISPQYEKELQRIYNLNYNQQAHFIAYKNKRYGIIDINNNIILPFMYKSIQQISDGAIMELRDMQDRKKLFSMKKVKMITDFFYDNITAFYNYFILEKNGFQAFLDADDEKILLPLEYRSIRTDIYKKSFIVMKGYLYGIVDRENKVLVPFQYGDITPTATNDLFIVRKHGEQGIINLNNEMRVKMKPCTIKAFFNHLEIRDFSTGEIIQKLDYNLKELKDDAIPINPRPKYPLKKIE